MSNATKSSFGRGLDVLFALGGDDAVATGGLGVIRIAEMLGRDRGQISRALRALEAVGLVERDAQSLLYRLAWPLYTSASRAVASRLPATAAAELARLGEVAGESAYVTGLRGSFSVTLAEHSPPRVVQIASWVGRPFPVYCADAGRALLFDASRDEVASVLHGTEFVRHTAKTPTGIDDFYGRLLAARPLGYTVMDEEAEPGVMAIAAPVRSFRGDVVAAVNVTAARPRLAERVHATAQQVLDAAARLSAALGYPAELTPVRAPTGSRPPA